MSGTLSERKKDGEIKSRNRFEKVSMVTSVTSSRYIKYCMINTRTSKNIKKEKQRLRTKVEK